MKYVIIIPARLQSTRLPRKPLVDILGKSMIQRTFEQCIKATDKELVYVATDSTEILTHCEDSGINVVMTSSSCLTGTDRIAEVAEKIDADYYINVQGDEPLINPLDIKKVINILENHEHEGEILNGYASISSNEDYVSFSVPKVVFRSDKRLMYMSRSPIPGNKKGDLVNAYRQICIYAFPQSALIAFKKYGKKTFFENIEDIEILRFLELGFDVRMLEMSDVSIPVDHPEDVEKVINYLNTNGQD